MKATSSRKIFIREIAGIKQNSSLIDCFKIAMGKYRILESNTFLDTYSCMEVWNWEVVAKSLTG